MVQHTQTILTDDIDGSAATQTLTFGYQGQMYEIDLNDDHAASLEESFAEWVKAARKVVSRGGASVSGRPSASRAGAGLKRGDLDDVRAWARDNGYTVSDRGRVALTVLEAYDAAH